MTKKEIVVVGAGLVGCLLSLYLARRGLTVKLFETRPDMRLHDIAAGRSINLSLSERGMHALKEVELYRSIEKYLVAMPGRMLHDQQEQLHYQPYGKKHTDVHYSISRGVLNKLLLNAAEATGRVSIFFNERCIGLDLNKPQLSFRNDHSKSSRTHDFETLVGADGAGSSIRQALVENLSIRCSQDMLSHGYKELTIPPNHQGAYKIEKNALHIWPRGGHMLIALPNTDGSFTVTLFLPHKGPDSFESLTDEDSTLNFFNAEFPDAVRMIPEFARDFRTNPVGSMGTIRCTPWQRDGKVLLIGDAAHAIVPFHGQGMNCGFEDCTVFNECLETYANWDDLFNQVEQNRKPNADAIADMALENYIEMRDSVRNPAFHLHKEIEWLLEERHPDRFIPRYSMVMFHRIPCAVAQERGIIQAQILSQLSQQIERVEEVDLELADRLVTNKLELISAMQLLKLTNS